MSNKLSLEQIKKVLPATYSSDTIHKRIKWDPNNPSKGHCLMVALLVQQNLGGRIEKLDLRGMSSHLDVDTHYRNILPDGSRKDLTVDQFNQPLPNNIPTQIISRRRILSIPDTSKRYYLFLQRFHKNLNPEKF